jgi:hypothetical protein
MALSVPTTDELLAFMHETEWDSSEEEFAAVELQQAADLMHIATGLTDDPADETAQRILKYGILEMAFALHARAPDREAMYSPFSSERIGSYSYSKAQAAVNEGILTNIPSFDAAVRYFLGLADLEGAGSVHYATEAVFERSDDGPFLKSTYPASEDLHDAFGR